MDGQTWRSMFSQQEQIVSAMEPGSSVTQDYGATDEQLFERLVVPAGIEKNSEEYLNALWEYGAEIEGVRQSEFGGGRIPEQRRREILLQMMSRQAYTRGGGIPFVDFSRGDPVRIASMTAKQRERGFIPIEEVRTQTIEINGRQLPYDEYLKNLAASQWDGYVPSQKQIENTYFAIIADLPPEEIEKRLGP
jgi:hypothetical protein